MNKTQARNLNRLHRSLVLPESTVSNLLRIERTLHRWHEQQCGQSNDFCSWVIVEDEDTGKPMMESHVYRTGEVRRLPIPNRKAGAIRRLEKLLCGTGLTYYVQTDPRGCALYVMRPGDVPEGGDAEQYYTRGVAICI